MFLDNSAVRTAAAVILTGVRVQSNRAGAGSGGIGLEVISHGLISLLRCAAADNAGGGALLRNDSGSFTPADLSWVQIEGFWWGYKGIRGMDPDHSLAPYHYSRRS